MASLVFLSENYVDESNFQLTTGTANAQFPLLNIKNESTVKKFRSIENNVVIRFDLQQTRTINSIALTGDATQTLGLTSASVKLSLTNDFSGFTAVNIPLNAQHGMGYYLWPTDMSYRYVEVTLTGQGTFCELSNIFIGERVELLQNSLGISSFNYSYKDNSSVSNNDYGQKFINIRNNIKVLGGGIDHCNRLEHEVIDDMLIRHQTHVPIWMIVDKDSEAMSEGNYKLAIYGYLTTLPKWSASGGQHFNTDIAIQQAV
jgi:hypothetical protein